MYRCSLEFCIGPNKIPCYILYDWTPPDKTVGYPGDFSISKVYFNDKEYKKRFSYDSNFYKLFFEELNNERREYLEDGIC